MKKLIKVWIIGALAVGYLAIFGVSSALDPTAYLGGSYDGYAALDSIDAAFGGPSVTISSAADQHFAAGSGITAISPITITDSTGAAVTALNDIRIRIPSGFNMEWDATDTAAAISGTASSKVNAAVTYEGANKVLVINVTSDFLAGEYITVSGLSFTNFSAASSVDYLGLDIYNAGGNFTRDNKAISISLAADFRYSGGSYDGYNASVSAGVVLSGLNGDNFLVSPSPNPASVNTTPNVTITITARDASNAVITSYAPVSTVSITKTESGSTAGSAILSKISLAAVDFTNGVATVTLYDTEPENVAVTATDQSYTSTTGASVPITFTPGALASFTITGYPAAITAGSNFGANNIVVTAKDALGNIKTDYAGTVYFTSTDAQAVLPYTSAAKYTFAAGDNGTHTFTGTGFTLKTSPSATVTVTDGTISQASSAITITPGGIDHYTITTTTPETAGTGWSEIVAAKDVLGNTVTTDSTTVVTMTSNNVSGGGAYSVGGAEFNYRKSIPITGSTSWPAAQTNYQVAIDPQIYNNTGLVGSWHFSEGTGTSLADMSGNGNTGTWAGAGTHWTTSGKFGNGGVFNGTSDYVSAGDTNIPTGANARTVGLWIKRNSSANFAGYECPFTYGTEAIYQRFGLYGVAGTTDINFRGQSYDFDTGINLDDTNWHYLVLTFDGTNLRAYKNSVLVSTTDRHLLNTVLSADKFIIGAWRPVEQLWNGSIDEVKVYNRALSADEISQQYNNGTPKVRHDYQDIRFTNASGTELPYWQETDSKFWVKADNIPNTTAGTTLNMYYGNPSAAFGGANANNGANTFEFFDDFSGTSMDASKWQQTAAGGSTTVSNSIVDIIGPLNGYNTWEGKQKVSTTDTFAYFKHRVSEDTTIGAGVGITDGTNQYITYSQWNNKKWEVWNNPNQPQIDRTTDYSSWHTTKIDRVGTTQVKFYTDGVYAGNISTYIPAASMGSYMYVKNNIVHVYIDWFMIGKHISPEPVPGAPGAEQGNGSAQFYTDTNYNVLKPNSQYTLSAGQVTIYSKDTKAETITLTSFDTVNNKSVTSGSIVINPAAAYKATLTAPASVTAGVVSGAFTLTSLDTYGNTQNVVANTVFNLTSNSTGTTTFYSDAGGTLPITSATIAAGTSSKMFYYKDTKTGAPTITATYASGDTMNPTTATASLTVNPAAIASYSVSTTSPTQTAGVGWSETVTAKDAFGNTVTTDSATAVTLSSSVTTSPALSNAGGGVWSYRKTIPITGSTGAGIGYQVKVRVGESSTTGTLGTDVDVRVDGHSIATSGIFNDIRFTASDGTTELYHWQESVTGTTPNRIATYWVKVAADLSTAQSIYIYYGNASATSASNGANTFNFFDDFLGSSIDISKWTTSGTVSVSGGNVSITNSGSAVAYIKSIQTFSFPFLIEGKWVAKTSAQGADHYTGVGINMAATAGSPWRYWFYSNTWGGTGVGDVTENPILLPHVFGIFVNSSTYSEFYRDRTLINTYNSFSFTAPYIYLWNSYIAGGTDSWDWVLVRKYASPEPVVGTPGAESLLAGGASSAKFYTSLANANSNTGGLATLAYTLSSGTVPIYIRDNKVETIILTATDAGSKTGNSSAITVGVAPANKIVFTSTAQTLVAGAVSSAYTVEVRDQFNNLRTSDALALTLSSSSGVGKFDTSAGGAFNGTVTSITTVNGAGTFYYKDTVSGTPTITVSCAVPSLISGTQAQTITAGAITPTITHASYKAGATSNTTVAFTATNPIPVNGKIRVTFGQDYDLTGVLGVVSGNALATVTAPDQILIINVGTAITAGFPVNIVVSGIKNPLIIGPTGTYAVKTYDAAADALIDQGTTAVGNTIVAPTLTLLTPSAAGITVGNTQSYPITWSNDGAISNNLSLYYANEGGLVYPGTPNIASAVANSGTYTWTVPDDPRLATKVKIEDVFYQAMKETTDTQFNQGTYSNTQVTGTGNAAGVVITSGSITTLSNSGGGNWSYKKSIPLTGSTGAGTGYQVKILVGESSATTGTSVNVDGHSTATSGIFNDVRFTASDGTTELSHWQESVTGTTPNRIATYWVKVNADLGTAQSIYIYYGNASATSSSNGTNTFPFFDDFNGASLDAAKWTTMNSPSYTISNSIFTLNDVAGSSWVYGNVGVGYNYQLEAYAKYASNTNQNAIELSSSPTVADPWKNSIGIWTYWGSNSHSGLAASGSTLLISTNFATANSGIWHRYKIRREGAGVASVWKDAESVSLNHASLFTGTAYPDVFDGASGSIQVDWIFIRKYASPEPAPGAPGSEGFGGPGIFTSRALDTGIGGAQSFGTLSWTANVPAQCGANAVQLQVAANNDNLTWNFVGPDGTAAAYFTTSGTSIPATLNGLRYIKYKAYLATADVNYTPTLQEVKIGFASPTTANRVISSESANTFIMAGKTSAYYLSAPADIVAGNTAQYTVTRKDSKGTLVTVGAETVTLASTSTGANKQFRAAAGGAALIPSEISIPDGSSSVNFYYYDEKMGAYTITASRTGVTSAVDAINVLHAPVDHLRFKVNIASPQQAAVDFTLSNIIAVDAYDNVANNDYGAVPFGDPVSGTPKTLSYTLSGLTNAPDGPASGTDFWTTTVTFKNGESATTLWTKLYRGQTTAITPKDVTAGTTLSATANIVSNAIIVNPQTKTRLVFSQPPSSTGTANVALAVQPIVAIRDTYGNQTADTDVITLYDSSSNLTYTDAPGTLLAAANPLSATAGAAQFSGVKFSSMSNPQSIYLYAASGTLSPAFSNMITLSTTSDTTVTASAAPVVDFNLIPVNDTLANKFSVLKFKVQDSGQDSVPTLIDRIQVNIGGTGANASTDIAWAGLYVGATEVATATGSAITNTSITFGSVPNGDSVAGLYSVADNTATEFTVYVYMKHGKLTATEGQTYTFGINETGIGTDSNLSSQIKSPANAYVATVTGTIKVDFTALQLVDAAGTIDAGAASLSLTAGTPVELAVRVTDANKNIDKHYTGLHTLVFTGLNNAPNSIYKPKIEEITFGFNISVDFPSASGGGVSAPLGVTLTPYKAESQSVSVSEVGQAYQAFPLQVSVSGASATSIGLTSGNNQGGKISTALANPFIATAIDTYSNPASGVTVGFAISSVPAGATGQVLSAASVTTGANGQASSALTLGNLAGAYQVTATSTPALTGSPLTFTATGLVPSSLTKVSGDLQSKTVALALINPLVIKLANASNVGVPNEAVTFSIISFPAGATGQALSVSSTLTDTSGQASSALTLGNKSGDYVVQANSNGFTVNFTATALASAPYKVVLSGPGSVVAGAVSTAFSVSLKDSYDNLTNATVNDAFGLATTSSGGGFYSDVAAAVPISSISVASGANTSSNFYYKDTIAAVPAVTATRTSGDTLTTANSSLNVNIVPADLHHFTVTGGTATFTAGGSRQITVKAYDAHNNLRTNFSGDLSIVFSGASASPLPSAKAPTCSDKLSADVNFGASTLVTFTNGVATSTVKLYKAETVLLKASAGSIITADAAALSFIVAHNTPNHLKFSSDVLTPAGGFKAGVNFALPALNGVDLYDNICDGANGGTAYSGIKAINYNLSGLANSPDGASTDAWVNTVVFSAGVSTTALNSTLYRAQATTVTAVDQLLAGTNTASNSITIPPGVVAKIWFSQQPSTSSLTNVALTQQPKVAVADQYGNTAASASDQITLTASTTSGTYTAVTNGALSGTALAVTTVNGEAVFSGIKYSYPEAIYLRASSTSGIADAYSFKITLSTAADTAIAAGLTRPASISSTACTDVAKAAVFDFTVTDSGLDGYATKLKQIAITRDLTKDTTAGWLNYIDGVTISDGTTAIIGTITDNGLTFGSGVSTIYAVSNGTSKTFTLRMYLKTALPAGADSKIIGVSINPVDITADAVGSTFAAAVSLTHSFSVDVAASKFIVTANTGVTSVNAGTGIPIYIKATDANGNIDKDYIDVKQLIFSGANAASTGDKPACTDNGGTAVVFGTNTNITFAAGQSNSTITMKLYKAEGVAIKAKTSDSLINTSTTDALQLIVKGGTASKLTWLTQPIATIVANAPWNVFKVSVSDVYGNTASSSISVTVTPTGGTAKADAVKSVAAESGIASFSNFAVYCSAYPGIINLTASAPGVTSSVASNDVTVVEKYAVNLKVLDSVNGSALTDLTLKILDSASGAAVTTAGGITNPATANSPFIFSIPYGKYNFKLTKDAYVDTTVEKVPDVSSDSVDGIYDNNITWTVFMMSISESLADYKVLGDFVYDENNDKISTVVRLEKRGRQITSDAINTLQTCTLKLYDSSDAVTPIYSNTLSTPDANGNYWFNIANATTHNTVADGFLSTSHFESGRSYFAKMNIIYGGTTTVTYGSVTTFNIGVAARLKAWTSEIKTEVAGVKAIVSTEARTIEKTIADKVTAEAEATRTKVTEKAAEIKVETAKILTAAETTIPGKITTAQEAISTTLTTEVKPHIKSAILNRETAIRTGDTITVRYRTVTGLSPTVSVYDPKNALKVSAAAMAEIGATGVYEYKVKFVNAWGTGEFTIVCSESTQGTVDAQIISVSKHDIEELAGQVSAVLGSTSGITGLKNITDTIGLQFSDMDKLLAKISKDVAGKLGEAKSAVNDLSSAFKQLEDMSKQIKNIGGTKGINLEKLYEVSKDKKQDIEYLKNKSEELKAAMELNQKMLENAGKKPVVQTWFEFK